MDLHTISLDHPEDFGLYTSDTEDELSCGKEDGYDDQPPVDGDDAVPESL